MQGLCASSISGERTRKRNLGRKHLAWREQSRHLACMYMYTRPNVSEIIIRDALSGTGHPREVTYAWLLSARMCAYVPDVSIIASVNRRAFPPSSVLRSASTSAIAIAELARTKADFPGRWMIDFAFFVNLMNFAALEFRCDEYRTIISESWIFDDRILLAYFRNVPICDVNVAIFLLSNICLFYGCSCEIMLRSASEKLWSRYRFVSSRTGRYNILRDKVPAGLWQFHFCTVYCATFISSRSPVPIEILEPRVIYGDHYYFAFTTLPRYRYTRAIRALQKKTLENLYGVLLRLIRRAAPGFDAKGILHRYYATVMRPIST